MNVVDCSRVAKGDCCDFFEAVHFNPAISTVEQSYQRFVGDYVVCFGGLVASWVGGDSRDRNEVGKTEVELKIQSRYFRGPRYRPGPPEAIRG